MVPKEWLVICLKCNQNVKVWHLKVAIKIFEQGAIENVHFAVNLSAYATPYSTVTCFITFRVHDFTLEDYQDIFRKNKMFVFEEKIIICEHTYCEQCQSVC